MYMARSGPWRLAASRSVGEVAADLTLGEARSRSRPLDRRPTHRTADDNGLVAARVVVRRGLVGAARPSAYLTATWADLRGRSIGCTTTGASPLHHPERVVQCAVTTEALVVEPTHSSNARDELAVPERTRHIANRLRIAGN